MRTLIPTADRLRAGLQGLALPLLFLVAGAVAAAAPEVPPLNDPPSAEWRPGKFVWIDLITPDPAAARRFYGELAGWSFADIGDYTLAYNNGAPVAGIARRPRAKDAARESRWIAYLSVPDVRAARTFVADKGGKVLVEPRQVPSRGEMAIFADPDDVPFGVIHSGSGDPPDVLAPPGGFIWAVYQSPAATRAAAFYQDLGDYEVLPADYIPNVPDFLLAAEGYARAMVAEIPADRSNLRPDWLYFLRVADTGKSVARAVALGARVIVAPRPDLLEGRLAVVTDPVGAPVGLLQWPDDGGDE